MDLFIGFVTWVILLGIYFLPAIVAVSGKKRNATAVTLLNLFLGWTLLGWVIALVWAATKDRTNV